MNNRRYLGIVGFAFLILLTFVAYFVSINVAGTFGLVATSLGLIIATIRLKDSTDNLVSATLEMSRNQILPRLSLSYFSWWEDKQFLSFAVINTGTGTAYSIKGLGTTNTGVKFGIEPEEKMSDLQTGKTWRYEVHLIPSAFREFQADFEYVDARGYKYGQTLTVPKSVVVSKSNQNSNST